MRKLLLICVCTMMVIVSSAQERKLGFGVKAGVAATSLTIPKVLIPAGRFQQTCFMHVRVLILSLMVMAKTE